MAFEINRIERVSETLHYILFRFEVLSSTFQSKSVFSLINYFSIKEIRPEYV